MEIPLADKASEEDGFVIWNRRVFNTKFRCGSGFVENAGAAWAVGSVFDVHDSGGKKGTEAPFNGWKGV
jgi:hypothetical protein